jgi:hypothetical protein
MKTITDTAYELSLRRNIAELRLKQHQFIKLHNKHCKNIQTELKKVKNKLQNFLCMCSCE